MKPAASVGLSKKISGPQVPDPKQYSGPKSASVHKAASEHQKKKLWQADVGLLALSLVLGTTFLATHTAMKFGNPMGFLGIRFGIAFVVLLLISGHKLRGLTRKEITAGILIGAALYCGILLQTAGLMLIQSSRSAFLTAFYVPCVPIVEFFLFQKYPRLSAWLSLLTAFCGLWFLTGSHGFNFSLGDFLTLGGAVAIAFEIVLTGKLAPGTDPGRLAVVQLGTAFLLAIIPALLLRQPLLMYKSYWMAGLWLGLVTVLVQLVANWAQKTVSAVRATVIYALESVWAGFFGFLAGDQITFHFLIGAALIMTAIFIGVLGSNRKKRKAPITPVTS